MALLDLYALPVEHLQQDSRIVVAAFGPSDLAPDGAAVLVGDVADIW
jgi:hypothetical protein